MSEGRHQRAVEKRLRDALKADRARIQIGRISQFGLMELSRQRLRASLQELSSQVCPHCSGLGVVRSTESCALQTLRGIQEAGIRGDVGAMLITAPPEVALYLLNQKRDVLSRLEQRYAMHVTVQIDPALVPPAMRLEVTEKRDRIRERVEAARIEALPEPEPESEPIDEVAEDAPIEEARPARGDGQRPQQAARPAAAEDGEDGATRRRRKRRRRRRRPSEAGGAPEAAGPATEAAYADESQDDEPDETAPEELPADHGDAVAAESEVETVAVVTAEAAPAEVVAAVPDHEPEPEAEPEPTPAAAAAEEEPPAKPKRARAPRKPRPSRAKPKVAPEAVEVAGEAVSTAAESEPVVNGVDQAPAEVIANQEADATEAPPAAEEPVAAAPPQEEELVAADAEDRPQRQGWWSRWVR
jgi:ribonuclease E